MPGNEPDVDFTLSNPKRRRILFFKRPKGAPIPTGIKWRCVCGTDNTLNGGEDTYCIKCGSRLRLQENADPNSKYHTTVIVSHFHWKDDSK
jgi:uncharacterized protein (DUF983 family)